MMNEYILGIESSCDDTAFALSNTRGDIVSNIHRSSIEIHVPFGGTIPELAARYHEQCLLECFACAMRSIDIAQLKAVAAVVGPGLFGGLVVGASFARGLSVSLNIPFIPIHHIEAHICAAFLQKTSPHKPDSLHTLSDASAIIPIKNVYDTNALYEVRHDVRFPLGAIVLSGGHTLAVRAEHLASYKILGQSCDDAVGEVFDKVGRMLGFNHPGGPAIEKAAHNGDCKRFTLPIPQVQSLNCSFSGLKTAAKIAIERYVKTPQDRYDMAASFQHTVCMTLAQLLERWAHHNTDIKTWALVGGVAANQSLMHHLTQKASDLNIKIVVPPLELCTDNGAMVAHTAWRYVQSRGRIPCDQLKPRWSLETLTWQSSS